jgi:exosortase
LNKQSIIKQKTKAIILVGYRDFGRCPLSTRLSTALWPVAGKTALEHLLDHLANQGIQQVVICYRGDGLPLSESIHADPRLKVKLLDESLPVGSAGCVRDAADKEKDEILLVLPAGVVNPPNIDFLLRTHKQGGAELTMFLNPGLTNKKHYGQASGIYICNSSIIKHIPNGGYYDIKEGLIPVILRAGQKIHAATLPKHAGNFRNQQQYLFALNNYLADSEFCPDLKLRKNVDSENVWMAADSIVDRGGRVFGPVVIMSGAYISNGSIVIGPAILGNGVVIGKDSIVVNSVLWDRVNVGANCQIKRCVIDYGTNLKVNTVLQNESIICKSENAKNLSLDTAVKVVTDVVNRLKDVMQPLRDKISKNLPDWAFSNPRQILQFFMLSTVLIAFIWSYWPGLVDLWKIWMRDDEYSSGLLVPILAAYILWTRRRTLTKCPIRPSIIGIFLFLGAQLLRFFGLLFLYGSAERLSLALSIFALVLLMFGWQFFKKVATILLFLCLMLPWPNRIRAAVSLPLQRWSTSSAVFCLELMGYEILQEGNVIHVGGSTVAVAEACNGLRMITAFIVICGLVVLLIKRTWWEKLIILASSLPIALLCNTIRLAITAIFFTILEGEYWEKMFHDFGGYAMMPLALAAVVVELRLLVKLTTPPEIRKEIIITRQEQ